MRLALLSCNGFYWTSSTGYWRHTASWAAIMALAFLRQTSSPVRFISAAQSPPPSRPPPATVCCLSGLCTTQVHESLPLKSAQFWHWECTRWRFSQRWLESSLLGYNALESQPPFQRNSKNKPISVLYAGFLLDFFFDPEDGGDTFFRIVGWFSTYFLSVIRHKLEFNTPHFFFLFYISRVRAQSRPHVTGWEPLDDATEWTVKS
jgi:hypothetical protein